MSTSPRFDEFFKKATGHAPYGYQRRLAGDDAGRPCESQCIDIPTGLGKTAAVALAWLWNRVGHPDTPHRSAWPRRLVVCLPMRSLVEQTFGEVQKWLSAHELLWDTETAHSGKVGLHLLMGGSDAGEWDIHPESDAILIGTQDMLLSRALNRGYGMARARWPMHFGLLNNDALWVLDETQLMGVGVSTSAQLEGLRRKLGTALGCATWWASATLDTRLLITPDHQNLPASLALDTADLASPDVIARVESIKRLSPLQNRLAGEASKLVAPYLSALAETVLAKHQQGTITLVILNRVDRAKDLCAELDKRAKGRAIPERVLVHSRFRPMEREPLSMRIKTDTEKIIIATQAVEAGVDISSRTLISELAPWSSMVQRFGRCNRKGEFNASGGADVFWINLEADDPKDAAGLALPYTPEQLANARLLLRQAEASGVSPATLSKITSEEPLPESHLLRRKDLVDLFDTTPDLAGLDLDIARYIRDDEERDVQVFWRELTKGAEAPDDDLVPERRELVHVAAHAFKKFAEKNKGSIWRRDPLEGSWVQFRETYRAAPGQIFLIDPACGGYSTTLGWTGEKAKEPFPMLSESGPSITRNPKDGQGRDDESQGRFQSLAEHTAQVVAVCSEKLDALSAPSVEQWRTSLLTAARWHDVGKAHPVFQKFLSQGRDTDPGYAAAQTQLLAKAPWRGGLRFERSHFRHELASALAWLQAGDTQDERLGNLVAYLIATHHGKVRLSLRSMPGESVPRDSVGNQDVDRLHARGIWHGDQLPGAGAPPLALDGVPPQIPPLDLSPMRLGETNGKPSWSARMISLRDAPELGLFRLAWMESLLRAADAVGSSLPLVNAPPLAQSTLHDLAAERRPMEAAPRRGEAPSSLANDPETGGAQHGVRERAGGREAPARDTQPDRATAEA